MATRGGVSQPEIAVGRSVAGATGAYTQYFCIAVIGVCLFRYNHMHYCYFDFYNNIFSWFLLSFTAAGKTVCDAAFCACAYRYRCKQPSPRAQLRVCVSLQMFICLYTYIHLCIFFMCVFAYVLNFRMVAFFAFAKANFYANNNSSPHPKCKEFYSK